MTDGPTGCCGAVVLSRGGGAPSPAGSLQRRYKSDWRCIADHPQSVLGQTSCRLTAVHSVSGARRCVKALLGKQHAHAAGSSRSMIRHLLQPGARTAGVVHTACLQHLVHCSAVHYSCNSQGGMACLRGGAGRGCGWLSCVCACRFSACSVSCAWSDLLSERSMRRPDRSVSGEGCTGSGCGLHSRGECSARSLTL